MDLENRTWTIILCAHVCSYVCVFVCICGESFALGPRFLAVEKHHGTFGGYHRPIFEPAESIELFQKRDIPHVQDVLNCTEFQKAHRAFKPICGSTDPRLRTFSQHTMLRHSSLLSETISIWVIFMK